MSRYARLLFPVAVLLCLLMFSAVAFADGGATWNSEAGAYFYNEPQSGIVVCTKMNVRDAAKTSAKSYGQIRNGQPVKILGITENASFYVLDLTSCGFAGQPAGSYGYAKATLIKINPKFLFSGSLTNLYATPWNTDDTDPYMPYSAPQKLKNGEQSGRYFLVLGAQSNWYAVLAMENSTGTAFIRVNDVRQQTAQLPNEHVVVWDAPLLNKDTKTATQTVKRFTTGSVVGYDGDYAILSLNNGAVVGYMEKMYLAPLVNSEEEKGVG